MRGVFSTATTIAAIVALLAFPTVAQAWNCDQYNFHVSEDGTVTVQNNSGQNEPGQSADVYIDGSLAETFSVPALNAGQGATLGTVSVPNDGFEWEVVGSEDCFDSGEYQPPPPDDTETPTETPTSTHTPTETETPTVTPTGTFIVTETFTPTVTPTGTRVVDPTRTPKPSGSTGGGGLDDSGTNPLAAVGLSLLAGFVGIGSALGLHRLRRQRQ